MMSSKWKRSIYRRFRASLPLEKQSDAFFKIFCSDVRPATLAIVGLQPRTMSSASLFYERNEHDYVDCDFPLARKMNRLLIESQIVQSADEIRAIPKLNVIFERSQRISEFDFAAASQRSAPFVREILAMVRPGVLLFEGVTAFEVFRHYVDPGWLADSPVPTTRGLRCYEHECDSQWALVLAHPTESRWSTTDWEAMAQRVAALCPDLTTVSEAGQMLLSR